MKLYVFVGKDGRIEGWGTKRSSEAEIEVEADENINPFNAKIVDGILVLNNEAVLQKAKDKKDSELNTACQNAILAGFTHVINGSTYWFSYDMEAQGNFRDAKEILADGVVSELPWTVRRGGANGEYTRIPINLEIMNELSLIIMQHKTEKISKYRDFLMPIVKGADTVEEVEEVKW